VVRGKQDFLALIDLYADAIRLDPSYALAFTGRAEALDWLETALRIKDSDLETIRTDPDHGSATQRAEVPRSRASIEVS
jgi:hypothetical protein